MWRPKKKKEELSKKEGATEVGPQSRSKAQIQWSLSWIGREGGPGDWAPIGGTDPVAYLHCSRSCWLKETVSLTWRVRPWFIFINSENNEEDLLRCFVSRWILWKHLEVSATFMPFFFFFFVGLVWLWSLTYLLLQRAWDKSEGYETNIKQTALNLQNQKVFWGPKNFQEVDEVNSQMAAQ